MIGRVKALIIIEAKHLYVGYGDVNIFTISMDALYDAIM